MNDSHVLFENDDISLSLNEFNNYSSTIDLYIDNGTHFGNKDNYEFSIKNFKKALEITLIANMSFTDENLFIDYEKDIRQKLSDQLVKYGASLFDSKNYEKALEVFTESIDISSPNAEKYFRIGQCFSEMGSTDIAIKYLNKSIVLDPEYSESYRVLGDIYNSLNNPVKAVEYYEEFILYNDKNENVYNMLGNLYHKHFSIKKSLLYFNISMSLSPYYQIVYSNFLFTTLKMPNFTQEHIYNLACNTVNEFIHNNISDSEKFNHKNRKKNEKIKIAYLSGDIKDHVVMKYILPVFKNHNKEIFDVYCYYNNDPDNITEQCKEYFGKNNFIQVKHLNNYQTAKIIYEENIDILIDLSGHTSENKVFVTAYKPAPLQVSYIGYANTTGIKEINYFLTNKYLNSPENNNFFAEELYFMDNCYWCFEQYFDIPENNEFLPCLTNDYITFGSFHDLSKLNDDVVKLWTEVLNKIPDSKLLICRGTIIEDYYYDRFIEFGIDKTRLIIDKDYSLNKWNSIDIHLDAFPFSGATIVFEALHFGIPTLTLNGSMPHTRQTVNINKTLGLEDFIASDKEDYINKAVMLSKNVERLKYLKENLKKIFLESDFSKYNKFTKSLEDCYIDMFSKYNNKSK